MLSKYIDFGISCEGEECKTSGIGGTEVYIPPELDLTTGDIVNAATGEHEEPNLEVFKKFDIWSLAVTMLEYILGTREFLHQLFDLKLKPHQILENLPREFVDQYPDIVDALTLMLSLDPASRSIPNNPF